MSDNPTPSNGGTHMLDTVLVLFCAAVLAAIVAILAFVHVPQENLPILASLATTAFGGVVGAYIAYRWGASDTAKRAQAMPPAQAAPPADPERPS